jgi:hypothetical protein
MSKPIESGTFYAALEAAGLGGKPISWSSNGTLTLGAELTDAERQTALDVYIAYQAPEGTPLPA